MNRNEWRLIYSPAASGKWNMALDEVLLQSTAEKKSPTTLRLYDWQPATLSLSFAPPAEVGDLDSLAAQGWGLVRRPTGGRAILHVDELTYSLTACADEPLLSGDLLESYRKISRALLAGLSRLSVTAMGDKTYENTAVNYHKNPVCFETPSNYEITFEGKKLVGSAQARKYSGILQHGTMPIHGDITRITRALKFTSVDERAAAAGKLAERAVTLECVLGYAPGWNHVANAMVEGFTESFGVKFYEASPSQTEVDLAQKIMTEKYASDAWTFRL